MKVIVTLALLLKLSFCAAQFQVSYTPLPFLDTIPSSVYADLKSRYDLLRSSVSGRPKEINFKRRLYDQRFEYVVRTFNDDYMMDDDKLTSYVREVHNKIYDANPQLSRETTVYTFRSDIPNAMTFGDGTVCVMLGLLAKIDTEDVLAFVLCHEIAHHHAKHAKRKIEELTLLNYDKTIKKQIDAIELSPYGKYTKLKALFNTFDLSINKHSREAEAEADSLALVYFLNTGYNKLAPLRCMKLLKSADSAAHEEPIDFRKYFTFKNFPFHESWIAYKPSDIWHAPGAFIIPDSFRTHPQTEQRYHALSRQLHRHQIDTNKANEGSALKHINLVAQFEVISALYQYKQYGKALFGAFSLVERFPDNAYAHAMIVKCLYKIYHAQKNHKLNKSVELPDPRFDERYNRFLTFVHKLRLYEIGGLAYHYAVSRPESFYTDEEFIHALWMVSHLDISEISADKIKEDYQSLYPKGRYLTDLVN